MSPKVREDVRWSSEGCRRFPNCPRLPIQISSLEVKQDLNLICRCDLFVLLSVCFRNCLLASGGKGRNITDVRLLCLLLRQSIVPELCFNGASQ